MTVSTVGVVPRLASLARDLPGVSLALSLHAPTQELRATLVPSARAYPLPRLLAAVQAYQSATQQKVLGRGGGGGGRVLGRAALARAAPRRGGATRSR